jgi:hypothetical protein
MYSGGLRLVGGGGCRMISLPICGALPTIIGGFLMDGWLPTMLGGLPPLNGGGPPWCVGADIMFIESPGELAPFLWVVWGVDSTYYTTICNCN